LAQTIFFNRSLNMKKMKHLGIIALAAVLGFAVTACGKNGDPASPKTYTVTFNSSGGSSVNPQTVTAGGKAAEPAAPTKANDAAGLYAGTPPASYTLDGWYNGGAKWNFASDAVTADITLTAKWAAPATIDLAGASGNNVVEKTVSYVNANPGSAYTLVLGEDVSGVEPQALDQDDTTLTITTYGNTERKISLGDTIGCLFSVGGTYDSTDINNILRWNHNTRLVIDGFVTLVGRLDNGSPLVGVFYGGSLDLKGNAKITGNNSVMGGGVNAAGEPGTGWDVTITMSGNAEISGNSANMYGGGVQIVSYTTFTMSGNAAIRNNTANFGGGVRVMGNNSCIFIMNGGEISHNTATSTGGGVGINVGAAFIVADDNVLSGIHDNTAPTGAQVYAASASGPFQAGKFTVGGEDRGSY
jgi:uncharacterized repeat protein (TIGR02543 family)